MTMNEEERSRFLATLHEDAAFRAAVQRELQFDALLSLPDEAIRLTRSVGMLSSAVNGLIDHGAEIQIGLQALTQQVSALVAQHATAQTDLVDLVKVTGQLLVLVRDGFQEMRDGFGSTRGELSSLRTDMEVGFSSFRADMHAGFTKTTADLDQVKADVTTLKSDVGELKSDVAHIKRQFGSSSN